MAVNLRQSHFRFGKDEFTESNHGWHAAEDTNVTLLVDTVFLLRFCTQETGGTAIANVDNEFQYNLNSGGWVNITTTSSVVKAVAAVPFTNGQNCTKRLSGTGTFESSASGCTEDGTSGGTTNDIAASGNSETECGLSVISADVVKGDTIQFRLTRDGGILLDGYDVTPTLTVSESVTLAAASGSFVVTGTAATLKAGRLLTASAGSYLWTGTAADLIKGGGGYTLTADAGAFTLTGTGATLRAARTLIANAGTYTLTGTAAGFIAVRKLTADSGSYALTGIDATLRATRTMATESAVFSIAGTAATLRAARLLTAAVGTFVWTGQDATLTKGGGGYTLVAATGHYTFTGMPATFKIEQRGDVRMAGVIFAPDKESVDKWKRAFPHLKKLRQILETIPNANYRKLCIDAWVRVLEDGTGTDCRVKETGMTGYPTEQTAGKFSATWDNNHSGFGKMDCT